MMLLEAHNLAAAYDGRTIFSGLALRLGPGVYALQGRNGSGKSTLLRLLAGAHRPAAGSITVAGHDLRREPLAARRALAYVPDETPAYPFMSGADFLRLVREAKGVGAEPVVEGLLDAFGLAPFLGQRFDAISLGTQKKLLLAAGWIGDPQLILLDEPSNALDAAARDALIARIREDRGRRVTLFASHDAEFVAATGATVIGLDSLIRDGAEDRPAAHGLH